jgi:alpha-beta hydrolase superfamily lysophospholipase
VIRSLTLRFQIWNTKPNNGPGWAEFFVRRGYVVYAPDLPFHGHTRDDKAAPAKESISCLEPDFVENYFTAKTKVKEYQEVVDNQWPGASQHPFPYLSISENG